MTKKNFFAFLFVLNFATSGFTQNYQELSVEANGNVYTIQYKIFQNPKKGRKVAFRDFVTFHLATTTESDSVLKTTYPNAPLTKEISVEDYNYADQGFMQAMLLQLQEADSAVFLVKAEDLFEAIKRKKPSFIAAGSHLKYYFKILKLKNEEEVKRDANEVVFQQLKAEEKIIAPFIAKKMPQAKRTYSGIWYTIEYQGEGDFAQEDDVVAIRYTCSFLDGKILSSSDQDGRLFEFPVNKGFAIKGLDQAMLLLKQGAKGTFIIPSYLAYGAEGFGEQVPPYSILKFDIEFVDIVSRKIVIENKGEILEQEKLQKEQQIPLMSEEQRKEIEKDLKKRKLETDYKKKEEQN
ncbi:MAG: FKBP-type peptidyl-prolyl cis-trans isomerase [Microscillaceae bacterium]|nr:FKBP-type peptidyl-prolyl cis-trans isomerase [Microscillaceae bacterium]